MRYSAVMLAVLVIGSKSVASEPRLNADVRVTITKVQIAKQFKGVEGRPFAAAIDALGFPSRIEGDFVTGARLFYRYPHGEGLVWIDGGLVTAACPDDRERRRENRLRWGNNQPTLLHYDRVSGAIGP